jgi:hypothetical protein
LEKSLETGVRAELETALEKETALEMSIDLCL